MRWQGSDHDRITVEEAKALFATVKACFPGRDRSMGGAR